MRSAKTTDCHKMRRSRYKIAGVRPTLIMFLMVVEIAEASAPNCAFSRQPEIWFEPADNVTQARPEFELLFQDAAEWSAAGTPGNVFFMTVSYLERTPTAIARQHIALLQSKNLRLAISILGLPVDKHVCGDAVEGMVWPGEVRNAMKRLKALGAQPFYISFDEPLSFGHFYKGKNACNLSISETARRLADSVGAIRAAFPNTKIVDAEVPTGKQLDEWKNTLVDWLKAYRQATGESLYGFSMDPYWHHNWAEAIPATEAILRQYHVDVGLYLHADAMPQQSASDWIAQAKRNICAVRRLAVVPDYIIVANWMARSVRALPESDPATLSALARWTSSLKWNETVGCEVD